MKKLISLLSILFLISLFVPFKQAEADRGSGGFRGDGVQGGGFREDGGHEGFRGDGGRGGSRGDGVHEGFRGDGGRGGFHGSGGQERFRGDGDHGGFRGDGSHRGFRGHGGFLPGLFIGGVLGWGLGSYDYPPDYYYPPPAEGSQVPPSASQGSGGQMFIYPRQGQSEEQQAEDVGKCHDWAVGQTDFDPSIPPVGAPDARTIQKSKDYLRAISACLDARGYNLRQQ